MRRFTPEIIEVARQLIAYESGDQDGAAAVAEAGESVCVRLGHRISNLVGPGGYRAVLGRALAMAKEDHPFLGPVGIADEPKNDEGYLRGVVDAVRGEDPGVVRDGLVAVVAGLLWLLVTFIGSPLVVSQLLAVWPDLAPDLVLTTGEEAL